MFQVVVVAVAAVVVVFVCSVASVLMVVILILLVFRCVMTIIVATLIRSKKITPLGCGKRTAIQSTPAGAPAPDDLVACDGRPAPVRPTGPGVLAPPA